MKWWVWLLIILVLGIGAFLAFNFGRGSFGGGIGGSLPQPPSLP